MPEEERERATLTQAIKTLADLVKRAYQGIAAALEVAEGRLARIRAQLEEQPELFEENLEVASVTDVTDVTDITENLEVAAHCSPSAARPWSERGTPLRSSLLTASLHTWQVKVEHDRLTGIVTRLESISTLPTDLQRDDDAEASQLPADLDGYKKLRLEYESYLCRYYRLRSRLAAWQSGVVPIWMEGPVWVDGELQEGFVPGFIFLSNETVRRQQIRLMRLAEAGVDVRWDRTLTCPLLKKPPFQLSGTVENPDEGENERLLLDLSFLRMVDALVANGFYAYDYIVPVVHGRALSHDPEEDWTEREDHELCDERCVTSSDINHVVRPARGLEAALHRVLERASPVQCLSHFSLGTGGGALKTTDAKRLAMQCMLGLEGEQDRIIAEGKQVICEILQRLYQMYTDARMLILLAGYKQVYAAKLEPGFVPVDKKNNRYEEEYRFDKVRFELECRRYLTENAEGGSLTRIENLLATDAHHTSRAKEVLDLTLCADEGLVAGALGLLNAMYSERWQLHTALSSVLIIVDPSEDQVGSYTLRPCLAV